MDSMSSESPDVDKVMNIGQLAKLSGVKAKLIRYYESIGLLPKPKRTNGNYRVYRSEDVAFLKFIKSARNLGFGTKEIAILLGLWQNKDRASLEVKELTQKHILALNSRINEMQAMLKTLQQLTEHCPGDEHPNCPILMGIANG